jgi:hypothetical protein
MQVTDASSKHAQTLPIVRELRERAVLDEYANSHYDKLHYPLLRKAADTIEQLSASRPAQVQEAALSAIAKQKTTGEWRGEFGEEFSGNFEAAHDSMIKIARDAIQSASPHPGEASSSDGGEHKSPGETTADKRSSADASASSGGSVVAGLRPGPSETNPQPVAQSTIDELGGYIEHGLAYGISSRDGRTCARNLLMHFDIRLKSAAAQPQGGAS